MPVVLKKLKEFIYPYATASHKVSYLNRQHSRLMTRMFFAYGVSLGLMMGIIYLAGSNCHIPMAFAALQAVSFIYGCAMLGLAYRMSSNQIRAAEREKFDRYVPLCELDFMPVEKSND